MVRRLIFILGGARSGKSSYAENWLRDHAQQEAVLFVATAQAFDADMQERIARHRRERPPQWDTLEAPLGVAAALRQKNAPGYVLLDCLTLLTANILLTLPEDTTQEAANAAALAEVDALLAFFAAQSATWLVVSNEVGMGVVPPTRLGRFYRDMLGRANQRLAAAADEVILLVAGLPWRLK